MTQEAKIVFDVSDIVNIRFVCGKQGCRGETACPISGKYKIPQVCPYCEEPWEEDGSDTPQKRLVKALRDVLHLMDPPVEMKFELDDVLGREKGR